MAKIRHYGVFAVLLGGGLLFLSGLAGLFEFRLDSDVIMTSVLVADDGAVTETEETVSEDPLLMNSEMSPETSEVKSDGVTDTAGNDTVSEGNVKESTSDGETLSSETVSGETVSVEGENPTDETDPQDSAIPPNSETNPTATSDVVDEILPQDEMKDTFSTDNPKAPDAKVKIITDSPSIPPAPEGGKEGVNVTTPPEMEETILNPEEEEGNDESLETAENGTEVIEESIPSPGYPQAQTAIKEMYDDVTGGINTRRVNRVYETWKKYASSILAKTNRFSTGLELNNRCRLRWYDQLYRNPISSVFYAEVFSRELYANFSSDAKGILRGIRQGRAKLDIVPSGEEVRFSTPATPDEAVNFMKLSFVKAANAHARALAPMTPAEVKSVSKEAFTVFSAQTRVGHTVPSVGRAQYLIDLMDKMDYGAMFDAAEALVPLTDRSFLDVLATMSPDMFESVTVNGTTCGKITTPAGDIIIGGREDNIWELDSKEMENVICLVDLGGNDTYKEGVCNPGRPIFVLIDMGAGDDSYVGTRPGIQGGAILGISLLYNDQGKTTYNARDIAQGSAIGGIGILIDNDGDDRYLGFKRVQGTAICGLGLMLDRTGNDDYHAALLAQGVGSPRGFGVLTDVAGSDHYYAGGYYLDSYPEPQYPGYDGWGQGIGAGIRGVACGGIGAFLEGDGDDVYEFDYFGHGGGYWMGVGFARDFGGNDQSLGATLKAYNGSQRTEARHQRFSNGFGCHYALGFLFDDAGNDLYNGTIMGLGMAWDLGAGFLVDFDGNDIYAAPGGLTEGVGAEGSLGFLFDYRGDDQYRGGANQMNQGYANGRITYHNPYDCGGNFSFLVDHGGNDQYSCRAKNNTMTQRGMNTGYIIDRPTADELARMTEEGTEVALDDKTPLQDSKQAYSSNPNAEWSANQMSNSVNPNAGGGFGNNGGGFGPGFFGGRRGNNGGGGGGFWPF